jgi:hypothetical protein
MYTSRVSYTPDAVLPGLRIRQGSSAHLTPRIISTAARPCSAVQMHPHATVLLDEAAAAKLERLSYYREVYANKPRWQEL